jgi:hypothetical protein
VASEKKEKEEGKEDSEEKGEKADLQEPMFAKTELSTMEISR